MVRFRATVYVIMLVGLPLLLFDGIFTHSYEKILAFIIGMIEFGYKGILELKAPIIVIDKDQLKIRHRYRLKYKEYNILDFIGIKVTKTIFSSITLKRRDSKDVNLPIWTMGRKKQKVLTDSITRYFPEENSQYDNGQKKV